MCTVLRKITNYKLFFKFGDLSEIFIVINLQVLDYFGSIKFLVGSGKLSLVEMVTCTLHHALHCYYDHAPGFDPRSLGHRTEN